MHIGIDGYEANTLQRVGIGQYGLQLLTHLHDIDHTNEYTIFLPTAPLADMPSKNDRWRYVIGKPGSLWTIRQLPGLIKQISLDVFFSPTHYAPWFTRIPKVLSIMDLSYVHYPELFRRKDLLQLKYMGGYSIKQAKKILTISEFSKSEIVKYYRKNPEDIKVTCPGINSTTSSWRERKRPIRSFDKDAIASLQHDGFILFVGTLQPRKNIVRLIEAFELLKDDVRLVLVGKKGWLYEPIMERMEKSNKKDKIIYLDFVSDEELIALYKKANCFVLPSLYEGFGLPVTDALLNGCPVVVSNTSSLPEVAGDTGIYVDPLDIDSIAQGLIKALQLTDEERAVIAKKGQEHITKFSWEECAKKTIEVFNTSSLRGA